MPGGAYHRAAQPGYERLQRPDIVRQPLRHDPAVAIDNQQQIVPRPAGYIRGALDINVGKAAVRPGAAAHRRAAGQQDRRPYIYRVAHPAPLTATVRISFDQTGDPALGSAFGLRTAVTEPAHV